MAKVKDNRARNWTFVLYPDSALHDWSDILNELHIQWCVSPLHDRDINPDGTPKKAHWHVLLCFEGNKSQDQVDEISHSINGTICQKVSSVRGMVRYFTHMDNPDKFQYSAGDIGCHGGFDSSDYLTLGKSRQLDLLDEIFTFIKQEGIVELHEVIDYARMYHHDDWYPLLAFHNCYVVNAYLKSVRQSMRDELSDLEKR